MKYLAYTTYCSGRSGLSNGIMSIEIGVILAFLMDRVLVLEGNVSPPANIVQYPNIISNRCPSRITDLFHLPIPWMNAEHIDLSGFDSKEFTSHSLGKSVFYFPHSLDIGTADFLSFARGRRNFLTYPEELRDISVLTMPGGPGVGKHNYKMANFSFYSYFFYLNSPTKQRVFDLLKRMIPQQPYREFASRVVQNLGTFNAVHIRRGDFKKTYGVTTLERTPQEVLEVLGHHFRPDDLLVILTDEMNDPFFAEIRKEYPNNLFLDQFILDNYCQEFLDLPCHDSISLAFVSQLIAAESQDFIGSMNSTYTSIIQRYRGNSGKVELFKFLWNELPDPDVQVERGRHSVSTCVPMKHGVMIEEFKGPYSWNRVNQRINPHWMREWPESFIHGGDTIQREAHTSHQDCPGTSTVLSDTLTSTQDAKDHESQEDRQLLKLPGALMSKDDRAFILIGEFDERMSLFLEALQACGWTKGPYHGVRLNVNTGEVVPSLPRPDQAPVPCRALVFSVHSPDSEDQLLRCAPGVAVGKILSHVVGFKKDLEETIPSLGELVQVLPVMQLSFSSAHRAVELVNQAHIDQGLQHVSRPNMETTTVKPSIPSTDPQSIEVQISLAGGHQFTTTLPSNSPILENLFSAIGGREKQTTVAGRTFFQIPLAGGDSVCSFASDQLVCVVAPQKSLIHSEPLIGLSGNGEIIHSHHIQIDNFLTPYETNRLMAFALDQESAWKPSTVSGNVPDYRKSVVLDSFKNSEFAEPMINRVRAHLPELLREFNVPSYSVKLIEAQLTASNDGDFFKIHSDNGFRKNKSRELTYVYYFYQEPKPFLGGELVLYDGMIENNTYVKADSYTVIEPRHNSIVFFLSSCLHEVLPIRCPSQAFQDSRFTVNGWVQRQRLLPPTGLPDSIREWAKNLN